jgi:hypothetical protein
MAGYCKISGIWESVRKYFKKNNGQWTEISENSFSQYKNEHVFQYGGDFRPAGPVVVEEAYVPTGTHSASTNVIYNLTTGKPNVVTNEDGNVVKYEWTDTGGTGYTVSDVDTGVIAFDHNEPGFTLHLVVEMTPNENNNKNFVEAYNSTDRRGLYVYTSDNYCYKKIQTANYSTNSSFVAWSRFSPTGRDNNYYKTRDTITIDIVYTNDKKLSLHINNVEHFSNFAVDDTTFQNVTIKAGVGMTNFTIKEFKVERTYGTD